MRTSHSFAPRARHGYALLITLIFVTVSLMTVASLLWWASSNGKVTQRNELFTTTEAAAEAPTEMVVATLDRDWVYSQTLQDPSIYQSLTLPSQTGWPIQFNYDNGSGTANKIGVTIGDQVWTNGLGSQFAGLAGYIKPCTITSTATTIGQLYTISATVQQVVYATIIPVFQFAIFYNVNLEIDPGAAMAVNGPVFCNQGIWAGTANVTFNSTVASAKLVYDQTTDPTNQNPWVAHDDTGTPDGNFAIAPLANQDSLTLPIGTTNNDPAAVEAIINLPPTSLGAPNANAYGTNGQMYLFNQSDLIISNSASGLAGTRGTNITIWFQNPNNPASYLTPVTNDFYALKTGGSTSVLSTNRGVNYITNVLYQSYSFVTNVAYYDYRESDTVQAVQVDVKNLNVWITNASTTGGKQYNAKDFNDNGHGIRSIFVYNKVPNISGQLPAVRMVNGAQLPFTTDPGGTGYTTGGLTVTTPQPLYVKGSYNVQTNGGSLNAAFGTTNTAATYPAALMGDAITILSGKWDDTAYTSGLTVSSRNPTNTTINAACLEGIVQSTNSNYSGGVENFLRLLENWNNTITLTYNGSIVVMFPSIYATSPWQNTGNYYNAPMRKWGFDVNFSDPNKLPKPSPRVYTIIRHSWNSY